MASNSGILIPPPAPASSVAATNDIRPIKPPVAVPNPWPWILGGTATLFLLGFVAAALILWFTRQKRRAIPPPVAPHVRARLKLEAALRLIHDPRAFAIAVSDAVRWYLEERFQLRAPERTTEEFLRDLQRTSALDASQKASLGEFLEQCDLLKFARVEPAETMLRAMHEAALQLVHETQYELAAVPAPMPLPGLPPPPPPSQSPPPPPLPATQP